MTDHMSIIDKDHNIVWTNEVAERLFGAKLAGQKCYKAYHSRKTICESCVVRGVFRDGQIHEHVTEVIQVDGRSRYFWCTATVAGRDQDGHPNLVFEVSRDITDRKKAEDERERLIAELQEALGKIKTLRGLIPICSSCKKARDDAGFWHQVEKYIRDHSEADFSHGICPECAKNLYPKLSKGG
jgi:PAS domain S-box-containing protein